MLLILLFICILIAFYLSNHNSTDEKSTLNPSSFLISFILCDIIKTKITTGSLILVLLGFHLNSIVFALSKLPDLKILSGAVCLKKIKNSLRVKIQVIKFECPQDFTLFVDLSLSSQFLQKCFMYLMGFNTQVYPSLLLSKSH